MNSYTGLSKTQFFPVTITKSKTAAHDVNSKAHLSCLTYSGATKLKSPHKYKANRIVQHLGKFIIFLQLKGR